MSSSSTVTSCAAAWCSSDLMAVHRWVPPKARQGACRAITAPSHTTPRSSGRRTTLRGPVALVAGGMRAIWHDSGLPWSRKLPDDQRPKPCHCMLFITNHSRSAKVCNFLYVYTERSPHPLSACYTCRARAPPPTTSESLRKAVPDTITPTKCTAEVHVLVIVLLLAQLPCHPVCDTYLPRYVEPGMDHDRRYHNREDSMRPELRSFL